MARAASDARGIREVLAAHWIGELGIAEAIWVIRVEDFGPLIADSDLAGNSLFEPQNAVTNKRIDEFCEGLKLSALRRHGETDDGTEGLSQDDRSPACSLSQRGARRRGNPDRRGSPDCCAALATTARLIP